MLRMTSLALAIIASLFAEALAAEETFDTNFMFGGGFVNGMVASHLLCHSGTINRHSLNGALLS